MAYLPPARLVPPVYQQIHSQICLKHHTGVTDPLKVLYAFRGHILVYQLTYGHWQSSAAPCVVHGSTSRNTDLQKTISQRRRGACTVSDRQLIFFGILFPFLSLHLVSRASAGTPAMQGVDPSKLRIPDTRSLNDCLRFWETGDTSKGLLVPLKDWPSRFKPSSYRREAAKWGKVEKVVKEFRDCSSDHDQFEARYPGLSCSYTKLLKAIDAERECRGELVRRPSKRQRTEVS